MRRRPVVAGLAVAVVGAGLALVALRGRSGADGPPALRVVDARVGETVTDAAALYLRLVNQGGPDVLEAVESDAAATAVLHDSTEIQGGSIMFAVEAVDVPAGDEVEFLPGGSHIMLEDLRAPLRAGDEVEVVLRFERHEPIAVTAPVVALTDLIEEG